MSADCVWVRIECWVASLYSYRIPDFNSFYALAAPVPSPSAVKLGLVSCLIEATGDVTGGEALFSVLRNATVALAPPERVAGSRVLVKRLKKPKEAAKGFTESFGIREYLHPEGPLTFWVQVPSEAAEACVLAAKHLRRIGTTDSIVMPRVEQDGGPDWCVCARRMDKVGNDLEALRGRLVMPLNDLSEKAELAHFAPINATRAAKSVLQTHMYLLPMCVAKQGANWLLYERKPFP